MSVLNDNTAFRKAVLGNVATKSSGTLASSAIPIFTIAGGEVMVTSFWLKVTTSITTDGGTLALQTNPTTGDTIVMVTATTLGTTDVLAGDIIGLDQGSTAASKFLVGGRNDINWVVSIGQLELLPASANGVVLAGVTWVPLTDGATLVAA